MQRFAIRSLFNLLSAAETVGDDEGFAVGLAHARQRPPFADRLRHLVMFRPEPEGAGHAAAGVLQHLEVEPQALQHGLLTVELDDGSLMAVPVDNGLALQLRRVEVLRVFLKEFAEQE
jgi:hypothetical protein